MERGKKSKRALIERRETEGEEEKGGMWDEPRTIEGAANSSKHLRTHSLGEGLSTSRTVTQKTPGE